MRKMTLIPLVTRGLCCGLLFASVFAGAQSAPPRSEPSDSAKVETSTSPMRTLRPEDVVDLILKQSDRAREIEIQARLSRQSLITARQSLDYQLTLEAGTQTSRFESATLTYLQESQSQTLTALLTKPWTTGTNLSLQYSSQFDRTQVSTSAPSPISDQSANTFGVNLEQNLWRNFFGEATRADLQAAELSVRAAEVNSQSQLQDLVLEGLRLYWSAYVAQKTFQESVAARDRYQKLVTTIQKKKGYGYTNPGELTQAQAELENREQRVRSEDTQHLAALDDLITLLRLAPGTRIQFQVSDPIEAPPSLAKVDVSSLRPVQVRQTQKQAAEQALRSTESKSAPDLSLVGRWASQGLENQESASRQEMLSADRPRTYVGLKFRHEFGSNSQEANTNLKRQARDLADLQLQRQKLQMEDLQADLMRRVQSTYEIAQSARQQRNLREKVSEELNRSYNQGRTDISIYIESSNKFFDSEIQLKRAIGNYQLALQEWLAFQDQLIPKN
jgi:outer membrane protein TolC